MALKDIFPIPVLHVNRYVWNTMKNLDAGLATQYGSLIPFFPLADSRGGDTTWGDKPYVVYDQLFRFGDRRLPIVHKAQALYFVRGKAEDVLVWSNSIQHILDRGDEAAQDCNSFLAATDQNADVFFHSMRGFQIDMVKDTRQDLAVRQYYTVSMIVEFDYHLNRNNFA